VGVGGLVVCEIEACPPGHDRSGQDPQRDAFWSAGSVNRDRYRRGSSPKLIGSVERIGCRCRRYDHDASAAHRPSLRIDDVVGAVRHRPAQGHWRSRSNGGGVGGEAADGWCGTSGYVGRRVDRTHLHDFEIGSRDVP